MMWVHVGFGARRTGGKNLFFPTVLMARLRPVLARAGFVIFLITVKMVPPNAKGRKPTVGFWYAFFEKNRIFPSFCAMS
jgi:hypothetical protein